MEGERPEVTVFQLGKGAHNGWVTMLHVVGRVNLDEAKCKA